MRLIDADALIRDIEHYNLSDGKFQHWVEIQPTIEPFPQWIPCPEDLPKKPCECIATIEVQIWENTHRIVRKTKFANGRFRGSDKVVAWMPLPEPYGGDKE